MPSRTLPHHPARLALCAFLACQTACMHWHTEPVAPEQYLEQHRPSRLRVTLRDSVAMPADTVVVSAMGGRYEQRRDVTAEPVRLILHDPRVEDDQLVGSRKRGDTTRVALADVARIERDGFSVAGTLALVLAPVALLFGIACLMACEI